MVQNTLEKMKKMHMGAMSQTYGEDIKNGQINQYTIDEYLARIVDEEWLSRQNKKIRNLKKAANFRTHAHPLNVDYTLHRELDKGLMERLMSLEFMKQKDNIIFTGPTGTGKSYLAQSIGVKACEMLHKVIYYPLSTFTDMLQAMQLQGNYQKWINRLKQADVLIIDDFGLTGMDDRTRKALMEIIDFRYDQSSIIIISQIPVKDWHGLIGENTIADAIMDRITHNSHRIALNGESVRKVRKNVAVHG